jgi:diguanylate cyclase (GGDEF)-like protein/PAS domain S-box-containing protein
MSDRPTKRRTGKNGVSARDVLEAAPDAIVLVDGAGLVVQVNRAAEEMFGYSRGELVGQRFERVIAQPERAEMPPPTMAQDAQSLHSTEGRRVMRGRRRSGESFPVEITTSRLEGAGGSLLIAAVRNVSEQLLAETERNRLRRERALYASELSRLARKDNLTGLPNRALFHERIESAISSARAGAGRLAVLLLDLDRFKHINESLGQAFGDWLLESVALRLTASVDRSDTVSRQGGDEFLILLSDVRDRDDVAGRASRIMLAVTGTHRIGTLELHVNASMGVAVFPEDGGDSETLIQHADLAMFHAKDAGRNNFQFFLQEMNAHAVERQSLESSLRGALERGEFVLHYQPKVDLASGRMIGAEALLRWRHPQMGLVGPERIVPLAEDTGLIVPIGQWVLREACRQAIAWRTAGLRPVPIAVNVSGVELRSKSFLDQVRRVLSETGHDPRSLEVELTESVLMANAGATSEVLQALKAMGLRIAVDDFGTGYSSLSYLARFPIDALKVDQSFVHQIRSGGQGSPIIKAVISMGKDLHHRVIAEGVETRAQATRVRSSRSAHAASR